MDPQGETLQGLSISANGELLLNGQPVAKDPHGARWADQRDEPGAPAQPSLPQGVPGENQAGWGTTAMKVGGGLAGAGLVGLATDGLGFIPAALGEIAGMGAGTGIGGQLAGTGQNFMDDAKTGAIFGALGPGLKAGGAALKSIGPRVGGVIGTGIGAAFGRPWTGAAAGATLGKEGGNIGAAGDWLTKAPGQLAMWLKERAGAGEVSKPPIQPPAGFSKPSGTGWFPGEMPKPRPAPRINSDVDEVRERAQGGGGVSFQHNGSQVRPNGPIAQRGAKLKTPSNLEMTGQDVDETQKRAIMFGGAGEGTDTRPGERRPIKKASLRKPKK